MVQESGTRPTAVARWWLRRGCPGGEPPLSHIPTGPIGGSGSPAGARGPLFIFRKIHLYGKTKKWTHGHTTELPTCAPFAELVPAALRTHQRRPPCTSNPHCTLHCTLHCTSSRAATITRPDLPCSGHPQRMHHLLSQDVETKTHDSDLPCTTRPVPPTLHHLPCTSSALYFVRVARRVVGW